MSQGSINIQFQCSCSYIKCYFSKIYTDINLTTEMKNEESGNFVVACYTDGKDAPTLFLFDSQKKVAESVLSETNVSYVVKKNDHYYAVAEHQAGLLLTLNSKFQLLSRVHTMGDDPCQITLDNSGHFIVVTNYSSASIIICKLENHIPSTVHSFITHQGSSVNPDRQASPHPHSSVFSEQNNVLFVADLGTDWVYYYAFNTTKVVWFKQKSIKLQGSGPRTLCRGRAGSKLLYLSCQLDNTIRLLSYKVNGLENVASYKLSQNESNFLAQIKYLNSRVYVAFRGDDKIMILDEKEEKLQQNCSFKVGQWPRYFAITPSGNLYVACQRGNKVQKYLITEQKIVLQSEVSLNTPSCIAVL